MESVHNSEPFRVRIGFNIQLYRLTYRRRSPQCNDSSAARESSRHGIFLDQRDRSSPTTLHRSSGLKYESKTSHGLDDLS
jgi:hypothetical protein